MKRLLIVLTLAALLLPAIGQEPRYRVSSTVDSATQFQGVVSISTTSTG